MDYTFDSYNTSNSAQGYVSLTPNQSIDQTDTRQMTMQTNGKLLINCTMSTSNSHVSPVVDLDRLSLITIDNDVDDAVMSANDITITTMINGEYCNVI